MHAHIHYYIIRTALFIAVLAGASACSPDKFLGADDYLLCSVKLESDDPAVTPASYRNHIRQLPNSKWFNMFKVPLALYCVSGTDTTSKANRFWRRIGEAPVVYNDQQTLNTKNALTLALKEKGYLNAQVSVNKDVNRNERKVKLRYDMKPGQPYKVTRITFTADNPTIDSLIKAAKSESYLTEGMMCDAGVLDKERSRVTTMLHDNGYFKILKNYIRYEVDTLSGSNDVGLKLILAGKAIASDTSNLYNQYHLRNVNLTVNNNQYDTTDSTVISSNSYNIVYANTHGHTFRPNLLIHSTSLQPGELYTEQGIADTYKSLSRLDAINYTAIQLRETDSTKLDADIQLIPHKTNSLGLEIEGTNTAGNFGVASILTYTNRNLFNGSEVWTTSLKGAYEAINSLEGYSGQNYIELGIETKLSFPKLVMPFLSARKYNGTSNLSLQFDAQERPEFHRRVFTTLWSYQWENKSATTRHKLDFPSVNYVYMPWISDKFRKEYLQSDNYHSALIRYAYENLLILNFTYNYTYNSGRLKNQGNRRSRSSSNPFQLNWSIESAGNLLYALSRQFKLTRDDDGQYTVFNVAYAQYVKFDFDLSKLFVLDSRNRLAVHYTFGIAQPYGNSTIVPFEKRYFAGGANGIRGWSVRELGPGNYQGKDGKVDFINQTGNLKLLVSLEWRSQLVWKFDGALFVDAGNIWTTREYEVTGKGGKFDVSRFFKQIAASYGIGLRMNLDYFILRFDVAMKAVNPAYKPSERGYLPLLHPKLSRDFAFHFAIGMPF
jgi:outer membrane protein assembly factor BamA